MKVLDKKIDFAVIINVKNCNPNGDPLNGNRPRINFDGYGEITDVCLKRKIRNYLLEKYRYLLENKPDEAHGKGVFVQSDEYRIDEYRSLKSRAEGELKEALKDEKELREKACEKWIDVRSFGQVFAFSGDSKNSKKSNKKSKAVDNDIEDENYDSENKDEKSVSIGIRGPVSIHSAFSVSPVNISSIQITKSVNGEKDGPQKASDTMGMKHRIDQGVYISYGSINTQLATKTGFSDDDAEAIKEALINLFLNDSSSARPSGSMEVYKVYWWKHNNQNGQYSSAKVHRSLKVQVKDGITDPKDINDYDIEIDELEGLVPEVIDGI